MKTIIFIFFLLLGMQICDAQYYYNDIVNNQKQNEEYTLLRADKYKKVVLESFESDDSPSQGFFGEKTFDSSWTSAVLKTSAEATGESQITTFYKNGRVIKTVNQTLNSVNTSTYEYGSMGELTSLEIRTFSGVDSMTFSEKRTFLYDDRGQLISMRRNRGGREIALIEFVVDSVGNVIEENPVSGNQDRKYFYYYDTKRRMTDVVHYNEVAQRLLPDFMFTYDENDRISQMISVDIDGRDYTIWRYAYTAEGLPEIQKIYSKQKQLLGTIQFEYLR